MPTLTAKQDGNYKVNGFDTVTVNVTSGGGGGSVPPATATPLMDGVGAVGTATKYAREDHVHPSDTSKVDKVSGKGLSTNDFTTTLKNKLDGIASGAEVNVQADWNQSSNTADDYIKNKPTIPTKTSDITNDSGFITDLDAMVRRGTLPTNTNLDAVQTIGVYYCVGSNTYTNLPSNLHNYGILAVFEHDGSSNVTGQLFFTDNGYSIRYRNVNSWSAWSNLVFSASDIGVSTGANKTTFTTVSGTVDNVSIGNSAYSTQSISIPIPTGSSRAAMFFRGCSIANATSSGTNAANCGMCWYYYDPDADDYKINIRNFKTNTARVKVTLYLTAAITS